jgi:hypothetical protein
MSRFLPPIVNAVVGGNATTGSTVTATFVFGSNGGEYFANGRGPNFTHISGSGDDLGGFIRQVMASQREYAERIRRWKAAEQRAHSLRDISRLDKLRALAERGATEGERAAARAAIKRIESSAAAA